MASKKIDRFSVILGKILKSRGMQSRLHEYRMVSQWDRTVGPAIARHARPRSLRAGKLYLVVDSPAWMQQLSLMKPEIIGKLNAVVGGQQVRDLSLKLGNIEVEERMESSAGDEPSVSLTSDEERAIDRYLQGVADEDLRATVRRVMEKDFQARKKRGTGKG